MSTSVVFIGWNQPRPGQERESRVLLEQGLASLRALEGRGFERLERLSGAVTGALEGGALFYGEREQLEALKRSLTFTCFERAMSHGFEGFAVVTGTEERLEPSPRRRAPRGVALRREAWARP